MPDTFAYDPDWTRPLTYSKRALHSVAVSGKTKARVKGTVKKAFELVFTTRDEAEMLAARDFWDDHYPAIAFNYTDKSLATPVTISVIIVPDSIFKDEPEGYNQWNYSFQVIEP